MIVEILSTGDEIRSGAVTDTNASYIAQALGEAGISASRHGCVGDDKTMVAGVLEEISHRADIALVTGGLGPTVDDITAEAAAEAAGVDLVPDEKALTMILAFFTSRKRDISPSNRKQALLPRGSKVLHNPVGTAPGFSMQINRCRFFFMPGVPFEMKKMLRDTVIPEMKTIAGSSAVYAVKTISTYGLPESEVNERCFSFSAAFPDVTLGLRAVFPEIHIKLYGRNENPEILNRSLAKATVWIRERMGIYLLSTKGHCMETVVGRLLVEKKQTLAVAESCTGGLISHRLTSVAGSSRYFLFSGVTYSNESKIRILGVSSDVLETFGAVHEKTAESMARGARSVSGADWAISTTGIAGPDGGTDEKPVGTVCIGISGPNGDSAKRYQLDFGRRSRNKEIFAVTAMDVLRRALLRNP
ncbi:MAG: competence/damage-inducible protein A [Desulfobacterales bacterium]